MDNDVLLSMKNISISFPGVKALTNVDFNLRKGEIHALMGENGAGKSTLIKVLNGVYTREAGEIFLEGQMINNRSTQEAQENGISTVFQEVNLCTNLSVAENIFAGYEPRGILGVDWKEMNKKAVELLAWVGLDNIDVTKPLGEYSVAIQQMVAIARAVNFNCKVLIL
ncbi:MAG: ATP-binding cassette domain-containing protein, partial [Treponema sp.]|nr:ATP-binding cassette domain-containing protein [Treponema sp.]